MDVTYSARVPENTNDILIPGGVETPYGRSVVAHTPGLSEVRETTTGQSAYRMSPDEDKVTIQFRLTPTATSYPSDMFVPHWSRFTKFGEALVTEIAPVRPDLTGLDRIRAVACPGDERLAVGHTKDASKYGF